MFLVVFLFLTERVFLDYEKVAKINSQIYQKGKSPNSPRRFGLGRAEKINIRNLSEVSA